MKCFLRVHLLATNSGVFSCRLLSLLFVQFTEKNCNFHDYLVDEANVDKIGKERTSKLLL